MATSSTPAQPTAQQLGVTLAQALTAISNAKNAAAIANFTQQLAFYTSIYGVLPNSSAPPPPTSPQIETVNSALVEQLEVESNALISAGNAGSLDSLPWSTIYSYTTYAPPIPPVPAQLLPTSIVQPVGVDYPGWYQLTPDGPSVPLGIQVTIQGATYTKGVYAQNPFSPNGGSTAWKQS